MDGSSNSWITNILLSEGLDPTANLDPAEEMNNQEQAGHYQATFGRYNSGGGGGGGANSISGVSEIAGSSEVYSVGSGNSVSNWESTLSFTNTYAVNGQSYTVSNDPHAAPTDGSTAYNVNANTGAFSTIANGYVNIGAINNLGTVGNDPIGPATSSAPSTSLPDLTAADFAPSAYTNPYGNQQALFAAIAGNMQQSGMGNTLAVGATIGEAAPYVGLGLAAAPSLVGLYAAGTGFLATGGSSATVTAGAFSVENGAAATGALASKLAYGASTAALALASTPQGGEFIAVASEFIDGAWGPPSFPAPTAAGLAGGLYGEKDDIEDMYYGNQ